MSSCGLQQRKAHEQDRSGPYAAALQCQMGKSWKIMENPCFAFQRIKRYLKSVSVCGLCGFAASGGVLVSLQHLESLPSSWCKMVQHQRGYTMIDPSSIDKVFLAQTVIRSCDRSSFFQLNHRFFSVKDCFRHGVRSEWRNWRCSKYQLQSI